MGVMGFADMDGATMGPKRQELGSQGTVNGH